MFELKIHTNSSGLLVQKGYRVHVRITIVHFNDCLAITYNKCYKDCRKKKNPSDVLQ